MNGEWREQKKTEEREKLTPGTQRIAVDFILPVLNSNLLRKKDHSSFRGTVGPRAWFQTHQTQYRRRVDDPSSMA